MADIFISYSRKDIAYARLLHKALSEHGLDAWVDWQDIPPSTEWLQEVYTAIEAAHTFIFLLSDSSALSEICSLEIEHAKKNNKRIIPIVINEVEPSKMHPALAAINWIFSRSKDELQPAIAALIEAIQTDYEWVKAHTRLQMRALEWERAGQDRSFLLQGTDLSQAEDWLAEAPEKKPEPSLLQTRYIQSSRQEAARRQRRLLTGVGAALVVTVVLGVLAFINSQRAVEQRGIAEEQRGIAEEQREVAEEQARLARVREMTAISQLPGTRFDIALLLGAETYNAMDTYQTRSNLLRLTQQHPKVIRMISHEGVRKISLSPDGKTLASINSAWPGQDYIRLWDVDSGQPLGDPLRSDIDTGDDNVTASIAFSPDGKTLACGYHNGIVALWDAASGQIIQKIRSDNFGGAFSLAFSPDGKILAAGGTNGTIILWDSASMLPIGQPLEGFRLGGDQSGQPVAFSPDGTMLAYTGGDEQNSTIILWDIDAGQKIGEIDEENGFIHTLAFHPSLNILASAGEGSRIIFWDAAALQLLLEIEREEPMGILSVAFSPDGKTLAAASRGRMIKMYDVGSGQRIGETLAVHTGEVTNVAFHPEGDMLVSSSLDDTIIFWDVAGETLNSGPLLGGLSNSGIHNLAFSPDATTLASGAGSEIILWDVASRRFLSEQLVGYDAAIYGLAYSPDGDSLAISSEDGILTLWDLSTSQPKFEPWPAGITENFWGLKNNLAFSPDGKILAHVSGHENRTITLWDTSNGNQVGESLKKEIYRYNQCMAFNPDGKKLAAGGEGETMLWDVASGELVGLLGVHVGWGNSLAFSPDGAILATGAEDGIILWDLAKMQPLGETLREHRTPVSRLIFNPDGDLLASASQDGAVILWDVSSRLPLGEPLVAEDPSGIRESILAFSPDGKSLVSFHEDGILSTWEVDVQSWHRRICDRVSRNFTRAEWDLYFPDEPYRKTCGQWPEGS